MRFAYEGGTVRLMDGEREVGSVRVVDQGDFCSLVDLKLEEGAPSGYGALIGSEGLRMCQGKPVYIEVDMSNKKAMDFYFKAGFVVTHFVMKKGAR